MLQEDLKKLSLVNGHESFSLQLKDLWEKYSDHQNDIRIYAEKFLSKYTEELEKKINEASVRIQLLESTEILPLSYIARHYFNKTKSWLYQRINENSVNGKRARFTKTEKEIFNNALQDISKRIGSINII
jgi:hypothetical protein